VIVDQVVHILQDRRRTRRAAQTIAAKAQGIYTITPPTP